MVAVGNVGKAAEVNSQNSAIARHRNFSEEKQLALYKYVLEFLPWRFALKISRVSFISCIAMAGAFEVNALTLDAHALITLDALNRSVLMPLNNNLTYCNGVDRIKPKSLFDIQSWNVKAVIRTHLNGKFTHSNGTR